MGSSNYPVFYSCTKLSSVTIGQNVKNIPSYAFSSCSGLTRVTSLSTTPPTCGTDVFYNVSLGNITLEVPSESVSMYQSADTWKDFGTIKGISEEEPELPTDNTGLSYNILNETDVEVVAGTGKYTGDIVIPSQTTIDGKVYNVTGIGNSAFYRCSGLTSVTIPNSVTSIGSLAFSDCSGLTSITIPNSVTNIGEYAFLDCSGLTSITIPNSVTSIGSWAFWGCDGLTSITIPNSVTSIGYYAFASCSGLTLIIVESGNTVYDSRDNCNAIIEISTNTLITGCKNTVIPNSVTSIGTGAFDYCSKLTSITISNSVTSIGYAAFRGSGLTSVTISNSVTSIRYEAFADCSGLTSIVVESGNTVYDSRDNCNAIIETSTNTLIVGCKNTVIPNSVTGIGNYAFDKCIGLTSISIPSSVASIGNYAFSGCSGLISIISLNPTPPTCGTSVFENVTVGNITLEVPAESVSMYQSADTWKDFGTIKGIVESSTLTYNILNETDVEVVAGTEKYTGDIVIPSQTTIDGKVYNVTKVGDKAFYECTGLISITIPNSVTSISNYAYFGCTGLTRVIIPNSVTSIGNYAFSGCNGLTIITISNSVTSIGDNAFGYCSGLTSVTIPNSVTFIGADAFRGCSGLTSITISERVTIIGESAFSDCSGLESIYVESENTVYDSRDNCNAIIEKSTNKLITGCKNSVIPNSVTSIGSWAFSGCSGLTRITIPNSVTSIGSRAFYGCSGLTSITIPNSVTSIGDFAFTFCI